MSHEQRTEEAASTSTVPALNLIFDGLFFLCFNTEGRPADEGPAGECRVGFLTTAPQHLITITGKRVGVDKPDFAFILSHATARRIQIDFDVPGVASPNVTRKGHELPIDRTSPTEITEEY